MTSMSIGSEDAGRVAGPIPSEPGSVAYDFTNSLSELLTGLRTLWDSASRRDNETSRRLFQEFRRKLFRHMAWEENVLFPAFERRCSFSGLRRVADMFVEHVGVEALIDQLNTDLNRNFSSSPEVRSSIDLILKRLEETLREYRDRVSCDVYRPLDTLLDRPGSFLTRKEILRGWREPGQT